MKEVGQTTGLDNGKSNFIVKISDLYCEWEFGFTIDKNFCINDIVKTIESKFNVKRDYEKLYNNPHDIIIELK